MKYQTLPLTKKGRKKERGRERERERERKSGAKTSSNFKNISKTPEKFSLVKLVTNYHKLSRVPIVVRP